MNANMPVPLALPTPGLLAIFFPLSYDVMQGSDLYINARRLLARTGRSPYRPAGVGIPEFFLDPPDWQTDQLKWLLVELQGRIRERDGTLVKLSLL